VSCRELVNSKRRQCGAGNRKSDGNGGTGRRAFGVSRQQQHDGEPRKQRAAATRHQQRRLRSVDLPDPQDELGRAHPYRGKCEANAAPGDRRLAKGQLHVALLFASV
jgi:hypothetical protein